MVPKHNGFTLIEILVAMAIVCLVAVGISTLVFNMARENRRTTEKIGKTNIERSLNAFLSSQTSCSNLLGPTNLIIAGSQNNIPNLVSSTAPQIIPIKQIVGMTPPIASTSAPIPTPYLTPDPTVASLKLITDAAPNYALKFVVTSYDPIALIATGTLNVTYDTNPLVGALHDSQIAVTLKGTPASGSTFNVTGCYGLQSAQSICSDMGFTWTGSKCVLDPVTMCTSLGGTWNTTTSSCDIPPSNAVKCVGQGGSLNSFFYNPYVQCHNVATAACGAVPSCTSATPSVFIGACAPLGGMTVCQTNCTWTCH
jgi:prepilin-type N-terminal cleavage/methylation domain-containing protein